MTRPAWQQEGREPDYRFSLANERTFLAWIRTALAVVGGGVLYRQFAAGTGPRSLHFFIAISITILGGVMAVAAYRRWKSHEIAMRHDRPLMAGWDLVAPGAPISALATPAVGLLLPPGRRGAREGGRDTPGRWGMQTAQALVSGGSRWRSTEPPPPRWCR